MREIFAHGWTTIKLYFMIGHPSETLEDVQAIIDLCQAVLNEGRRRVGGARARTRRGEHLHPQAAHAFPVGLLRLGRPASAPSRDLLRNGAARVGLQAHLDRPEDHPARGLALARRPPHRAGDLPRLAVGQQVRCLAGRLQARKLAASLRRLRPRPGFLQPPRARPG